jgi:hypothetical protein
MSRHNRGFVSAGSSFVAVGIVTFMVILLIALKVLFIWACLSIAVSVLKNYQGCDRSYAIDSIVASNLFCPTNESK